DDAVTRYLGRQARNRPARTEQRRAPSPSPSRDVFIDVEMLGATANPAMLGARWAEGTNSRHAAFLLDSALHPAAVADREMCRACPAVDSIEMIVSEADEGGVQ